MYEIEINFALTTDDMHSLIPSKQAPPSWRCAPANSSKSIEANATKNKLAGVTGDFIDVFCSVLARFGYTLVDVDFAITSAKKYVNEISHSLNAHLM